MSAKDIALTNILLYETTDTQRLGCFVKSDSAYPGKVVWSWRENAPAARLHWGSP